VPEFDLTIFTIATNKYFKYFELQINQLVKHVGQHQRTQIVVATNMRTPGSERRGNLSIDYVSADDFKWPEITLLRYHQMLQNSHNFKGSWLMWLDTDMEIIRDIKVNELSERGTLLFAKHPAFIFDTERFWTLTLVNKARAAWPWLTGYLKGQLHAGTWEERRVSTAYVKRHLRKVYVHGAVWMGTREKILTMAETLAGRINDDLSHGIVAAWHDESHLNWYSANVHESRYLPEQFSGWKDAWQYCQNDVYMHSLDKKELDLEIAKGMNDYLRNT